MGETSPSSSDSDSPGDASNDLATSSVLSPSSVLIPSVLTSSEVTRSEVTQSEVTQQASGFEASTATELSTKMPLTEEPLAAVEKKLSTANDIRNRAAFGKGTTSIPALMEEIRSRTRSELASRPAHALPFKAHQARGEGDRPANGLLTSEELRYLNFNYAFPGALDPGKITSHRFGPIGKVITTLKKRMLRFFRDAIFKPYFEAEREYNAQVVRYLNEVAKHVAERDAQIFWELVHKIDVDVQKCLDRVERVRDEDAAGRTGLERRLGEALGGRHRLLEQGLSRATSTTLEQEHRIRTVERVASGIEAAFAILGNQKGLSTDGPGIQNETPSSASEAHTKALSADPSYVLLENRFRGSEDEIRERCRVYPSYFRESLLPVLEIGPGRGELQSLLKHANIPSYGVDIDRAMVQVADAKGFDIRHEDAIAHLKRRPDRSLGGVIAVQVIEHLSSNQLTELITECARVVAPGSRIIFETINPQSISALSSNYFRDPTHVFPGHPDTIKYRLELAGLEVEEIRYLSPVPESEQLRSIPLDETATPRWGSTVEVLNHNISKLNALLYGHQDYAVIARVKKN